MIQDNPAAHLHSILKKGKELGDTTTSLHVWEKLLDAKKQ